MDQRDGTFKSIEADEAYQEKQKYPEFQRSIFKVGELIPIKNSLFRVKSIKPDELRLKLMPKMDRAQMIELLQRQLQSERLELMRRGMLPGDLSERNAESSTRNAGFMAADAEVLGEDGMDKLEEAVDALVDAIDETEEEL